ncbi:hypothetical protein [Coleofasciculus sp.]|uniref:hypothetical protein n=1 Tax=Coleofasciculus sp. TaxID=3100458 RepID=UPI003A148156
MPTYKVYVRGHGGEDQHLLPPSEELPIDVITVGQFGSSMSDEVADAYIFGHIGIEGIREQIENEIVIYWTLNQRNDWYNHSILNYSKPDLTINSYATLNLNLALDGDSEIGKCGVCYWDENTGELQWIIKLKDGETIFIADILQMLKKMLSGEDDIIQLFWTACMSAKYWIGNQKKVSFNPKKQ